MNKMICDFHTHMFPDAIAARALEKLGGEAHLKPHTEATASSLLQSMEEGGIDLSVVLPVATAPRQVMHLNDAAARLNETYQGRLFSFGAMHPDFEDAHAELKRIKELGLKGIKLHPVYQGTDIDDIRTLRILYRAAELDLIVVTHAGLDIAFPGAFQCTPEKCRRAVDAVGPFRFVLAHMGGWKCWDRVPEYLAGCGVYIDTAFSCGRYEPLSDGFWNEEDCRLLSEEKSLELIRAFGTDHVLFGSDSPWSSEKESRRFIEALPLTAEEKADILGRNALQLLGSS